MGYDLLISFQQLSQDGHAEYQDSHKADGSILLGYGNYLAARERRERLQKQGTHFVRWGGVVEGQPDISIGCDNVAGGEMACAHLLAQGNLARRQTVQTTSNALKRSLAHGTCQCYAFDAIRR